MEKKKLLAIVAGPHCSGNTATMVGHVVRGAEETGFQADLRCLGAMDIRPLLSSPATGPYGVAHPDDDMGEIYPLLESMDAFVFGTPIYFDHVSARAKIFIDRLIRYYGKEGLFPKGVATVVVITHEWEDAKAYLGVIDWLKGRFENYFGMRVVGSLVGEGTARTPVSKRPELLDRCQQLGRELFSPANV